MGAYTSTFNSHFVLYFAGQNFNLIILEGIHSLICVFIQHIEPIQSFDAEPSVGSRKKKLKANAQRAKKYHQDRMRSEPFLILLLFSFCLLFVAIV
jgi:hypothetical protein